MSELWTAIPGYEGHYEVSDLGRVRSIDRVVPHGRWGEQARKGVVLKQSLHSSGYMQVGLCMGGKMRHHLVQCLVLLAFKGQRPPGMECCHGDGDSGNNRLDNLRYDTKVGNAADKVRHGTNNAGETNVRAKLTAEQVAAIFARCKSGESQQLIAADLGISPVTVNHIATGRTWVSVTGEVHQARRTTVTPVLVRYIAELQERGLSLEAIAIELEVSKATVSRHSKGKSKVKEKACA